MRDNLEDLRVMLTALNKKDSFRVAVIAAISVVALVAVVVAVVYFIRGNACRFDDDFCEFEDDFDDQESDFEE